MIALLALLTAAADPVATAAFGLVAQIEDDNGPDAMMTSITSKRCMVTIAGGDRRWMLDMAKADGVALEDTFVYISALPHNLAIVGDASKRDQAAKLRLLAEALADLAARCRRR